MSEGSGVEELRGTIQQLSADLTAARGAVRGVIADLTQHREEMMRWRTETEQSVKRLRADFLDVQQAFTDYESTLARRLLTAAQSEADGPPPRERMPRWGLYVLAGLVVVDLVVIIAVLA